MTPVPAPATLRHSPPLSMRIMKAITTVLPALMLPLLLAACGGTSTARGPGSGPGDGPAPQLTVERFLDSVSRNDWSAMAELFGTPEENISQRDGPERAERHMQVLASLLRHQDFTVEGQRSVPGRPEAVSILVRINRDDEWFAVPFTVVPRNAGGWIIELIENLEELA